MNTQNVSTSDEWEVGKEYHFQYNIEKVSIAGLTVPDFLIPDAVRQSAIEHSVTSALTKLASDNRLRVKSYTVDKDYFTVNAIATGHASPIEYIVFGIIAVFAIYGISLVLNQVSKVVSAGTAEIDLGDGGDNKDKGFFASLFGSDKDEGTKFKLPLIPIAVIFIAFLMLRK